MSSPRYPDSPSRSRSRSSSEDLGPRKVARKERKKYSCEECRRLKLKCNREFPCENCIKRGCKGICPRGVRPTIRVPRKPPPPSAREKELERLLAENGISVPGSADNGTRPRTHGRSSEIPVPSKNEDMSDAERLTFARPVAPVSSVRTHQHSPEPLRQSTVPRHDRRQMSHATRGPTFDFSTPPAFHGSLPVDNGVPGDSSLAADSILPVNNNLPVDNGLPSNGMPLSLDPETQFGSLQDAQLQPPAEAAFLFDDVHSSGTLVITASGRSKYLGPRAGNEWLKDQEIDEPDQDNVPLPLTRTTSPAPTTDLSLTPLTSLSAGPLNNQSLLGSQSEHKISSAARSFPFSASSSSRGVSISSLLRRLPPESQGRALLDSYFRYFEWSYNIIPRNKIKALIDRVYSYPSSQSGELTPDSAVLFVHQLALVFTVLAMGAVHHLELQPDDPMVEEFLAAARACLTKGNFLVVNTVPGVQCLHLMAHVNLETERGKNGDTAWPLWGLAMRMIQAMGLHRDGLRWNLPSEDTEERRLVFWNMQAADTFQANCFSRPNSIQLRYCDVQFPHDDSPNGDERGFHTIKYQIAQLSAEILDQTLDLTTPTMDAVMSLHTRLTDFEQNLPYPLRCRSALLALPSMYSNSEEAIRASPESDRWDLQLTFRQFFIALLLSESCINLHRPYFVKALQSRPADPVKSPWGASFLVVVERSNVLIQLAVALHAIHPHVSARHWFLWYHAFNSAVTLGTVVLADPCSDLAGFCIAQMDQIIAVYTTLVLNRSSPRMSQNLRWLMRLRQRAAERLNTAGAELPVGDHGQTAGTSSATATETEAKDAELLGWRTRLIERTPKGVRRATTIVPPGVSGVNATSPATLGLTTPSPNTRLDQHITSALDQILAGPSTHVPIQTMEAGRGEVYASTEQMLHSFWDPTTILGVTGDAGMSSVGWWDLEFPLSPAAAEGATDAADPAGLAGG